MIIDTTENTPLKIGATGIEDIKQCLHILLTTIAGTVFLDRQLGISNELIDQPLNKLGYLNQEIINKINEYEPRVVVKEVKILQNNITGKAEIRLEVDVLEEYL